LKFAVSFGRVPGFPYNGEESIVYPFRLVPLLLFMAIKDKKNLEEYIQLNVYRNVIGVMDHSKVKFETKQALHMEKEAMAKILQECETRIIKVSSVGVKEKKIIGLISRRHMFNCVYEQGCVYITGSPKDLDLVYDEMDDSGFMVEWVDEIPLTEPPDKGKIKLRE